MQESDLFADNNEKTLLAAFAWWEKKRLLFNALTGIACLTIVLLFGTASFGLFDLFVIFLWALTANVFYSIGFLLEPVLKYYVKSDIDLSEKGQLFSLGNVFTIIATLLYGFLYYNSFVAQP